MQERNLLHEICQLDKIALDNECVLYGAGRVARTIVKHLAQKKIGIKQIFVSTMRNNPVDIMGIPVYEIGKYKGKIEEKILIICSKENLHNELENESSSYNFAASYFISDDLFQKITFDIGDYEIENYYEVKKLEQNITEQNNELLRLVPRPCLEYLILNILDHCNLRCQGCDHFACISDKHLVPYEVLHRDLDRLAEIFQGDYIDKIAVMGGEPLLHPELLNILTDVRAHFPYTIIRLTTNGLLLLKQNNDFWRVCRENDVTIVNTKYPINLDFDMMQERAKEEQVKFQYFEQTGEHIIKKSFKKYINLKGDGNPVENFVKCPISNYGNFLMEGKLYGCPFSCQSYRIFNKKFNENLRMTEDDYLDIYKINNKKEVFDFAARPKYYCRYCMGLSTLYDWARSKGDIYEWLEKESK